MPFMDEPLGQAIMRRSKLRSTSIINQENLLIGTTIVSNGTTVLN